MCVSGKFEYVGDQSQMRREPNGTDRKTFSVATGDYVTGRSAGYESQAKLIRELSGMASLVCYLLVPSEEKEDHKIIKTII